jgi:hypothetical protein
MDNGILDEWLQRQNRHPQVERRGIDVEKRPQPGSEPNSLKCQVGVDELKLLSYRNESVTAGKDRADVVREAGNEVFGNGRLLSDAGADGRQDIEQEVRPNLRDQDRRIGSKVGVLARAGHGEPFADLVRRGRPFGE